MKRTAIYMRVSTDRQAQEGDSISAQRDALRKYIDNHEDMILAGEYLDDGVSGTRADRDELQRLLEDVKAGRVDLILVTKLDRLYRSIRHYLNMMDVLDKHGVGWRDNNRVAPGQCKLKEPPGIVPRGLTYAYL